MTTTAPLFISYPAFRTTLGFVGETLGSKEFLLASSKGETHIAVYALKGFVCIGHR